MELVKNIFFNTDKLVENTKVKISYTGNLFNQDTDEVYLHYGFGPNWDNTSDVKMEKTDLGFQAEIELVSDEPLYLCFRNSENVWDNNNGQNYMFHIERFEELSLVPQEPVSALDMPRRLRKSYLWSKKIRLAIYKIIHYFPKIISGNYKKNTASN